MKMASEVRTPTQKSQNDLSIKITESLMRTVGIWTTESAQEQRLLDMMLAYAMAALSVAVLVEFQEFYFSLQDFYEATNVAVTFITVLMIMIKVSSFLLRRTEIIGVIRYTQKNFWHYEGYSNFDRSVLNDVNHRGLLLVGFQVLLVALTTAFYIVAPLIENMDRDEDDRILPFKIYLNLPFAKTPYFETMFVVETLALFHASICFCCFDNFFAILCLHAAGQFRILHHSMETIFEDECTNKSGESAASPPSAKSIYRKLNSCIERHQELIRYVAILEKIFSFQALCQMMATCLLLCICGFLVVMDQSNLVRRLLFTGFYGGTIIQLCLITSSANELIVHSESLSSGVYQCNWEVAAYPRYKRLRENLIMVMLRSRQPCQITANGFAVLSLETFMAVVKMSASCFTLLRTIELDNIIGNSTSTN